MAWLRLRRVVMAVVLGATLVGSSASTALAAGPSVRGGGVVGGALGTTSQLGFTATSAGGRFLCVMAGRSGGFPFGPFTSIQQMHVEGRVMPGSLQITGNVARFEGTATIHVVGTSAAGILNVTLRDMHFISTQGAGGAGVAWHTLDVPDVGPPFGPEELIAGHITISP